MMLLDRYVLKQFTKHLLLVLCSLLAIYLLVDFFERIDNFLEAGKPAGLAARYLLMKVPLMGEQLLPVCLLLAGVITLGLLNRSREFLALKAGGICATRVIRPLIGGAVLVTLLALASSQWLLPPTVEATNRIWFEEVKQQIPRGIERNGRTFFRGEGGIYSFSRPDPQQNHFVTFTYTAWNERNEAVLLLTAEEAEYTDAAGWSFSNGQLKKRTPAGGFEVKHFTRLSHSLPDRPAAFFTPQYREGELPLSTLMTRAQQQHGRAGIKARAALHQRLSYLFLGIPLLLLGLPILLIMSKKWGRDLSLAIPISCGLAFAAWGWWSAAQALATVTQAPPALSAWSMHGMAVLFGTLLIRRQNR